MGETLGLYGDPFEVSDLAGELAVTPVKKSMDAGLTRASVSSPKPPKLGGIDSRAEDENVKQDDKIFFKPTRSPRASRRIPAAWIPKAVTEGRRAAKTS